MYGCISCIDWMVIEECMNEGSLSLFPHPLSACLVCMAMHAHHGALAHVSSCGHWDPGVVSGVYIPLRTESSGG